MIVEGILVLSLVVLLPAAIVIGAVVHNKRQRERFIDETPRGDREDVIGGYQEEQERKNAKITAKIKKNNEKNVKQNVETKEAEKNKNDEITM